MAVSLDDGTVPVFHPAPVVQSALPSTHLTFAIPNVPENAPSGLLHRPRRGQNQAGPVGVGQHSGNAAKHSRLIPPKCNKNGSFFRFFVGVGVRMYFMRDLSSGWPGLGVSD